jgi:hypothetical protein
MQDGSTTITLTVPTSCSSAAFIQGQIKQGFVTADGLTFYPISWVASFVASAP